MPSNHTWDNIGKILISDLLNTSYLANLERHPSGGGGGEKSQVVGSNVLVLTMRNKPMKFTFIQDMEMSKGQRRHIKHLHNINLFVVT